MKINLTLSLLFLFLNLYAQQNVEVLKELVNLNQVSDSNEDFTGYEAIKEIIQDAEIVMLGEQSHGDATTYETKIKLIKYLHQKMDFDILAFESGFFECQKAWTQIQKGEDVRTQMGKSIFDIWSAVKDLKPLVEYIEGTYNTAQPLAIAGFDSQMLCKLGSEFFVKDLKAYLSHTVQLDTTIDYKREFTHLENSINLISSAKFKEYKKEAAIKDIAFLDIVLGKIQIVEKDTSTSFWIQNIINTKLFLSDLKLKTDHRDQQMAENLIWLKEQYPNKKIICWGATSHFLYNSSEVRMDKKVMQLLGGNHYKKHAMMGDYIKEKYGKKVCTIGFIAYEGYYGYMGRKKLSTAKNNSLEYLIGKSGYDNCLLSLRGLSLSPYISRPLGHFYMKTDITRVMDAVIFNRYMKAPELDVNFFLKIYPENKYLKPIPAGQ